MKMPDERKELLLKFRIAASEADDLLTSCDASDLLEAIENKDAMVDQNILRIGNALSEISIAVEMPRQEMERFLFEIMGTKKHVLDIMREEGHKKVYHLALHAKKCRTRKKNFNRARRILAKEV